MNTFKNRLATICAVLAFVLTGVTFAQAQSKAVLAPRPSQKASVMQSIGVTDVTITYSRPGVKARKIWGEAPPDAKLAPGAAPTATLDNQNTRVKDQPIVPYGHVWRAGANEATMFAVTDDVLINGQKLAAGTYSLHAIPTATEWTLIFNSDAGQWGSFSYDEKKDVLRVKAKPQATADNEEWLSYSIPEVGPTSARVVLRWEKIAVPFTVEVPSVEAAYLNKVKAALVANPADYQSLQNLAVYYAGDKKWEDALNWIDQSIKLKETFGNLANKSNMLFNSGKKEESFTVGDQAVARGKADKANPAAVANFEKTLAERRTAK
ncbi:MAG: DUF2911 domain-containing protein [Pyrinomonadaceae bacterium]